MQWISWEIGKILRIMCSPKQCYLRALGVGWGDALAVFITFVLREREFEGGSLFLPLFRICFVIKIFFEKYHWLGYFFYKPPR